MKDKIFELQKGVKLHLIKTDLFKTNLSSVIITLPLNRETVTLNALIPFLLRRGTQNLKTQYDINKKLENLYGSIFDCGIDKSGDKQILKFYMEGINNDFIENNENLLKENLDLLFEIVFNPLLENNMFKDEFLNMEKNNLENVIRGKIDDKDSYAFNDCVEKIYGQNGFGLYKLGYLEDLENINAKQISDHYLSILDTAKIDIFISGNFDYESVKEIVEENENIKKLQSRDVEFLNNDNIKTLEKQENEYIEKMNVTQGKLIMAYDIDYSNPDYKYVGLVYNAILGETATSKMFQNVREKASLAYTARSVFIRQKKNIFIRCGIEIPNYEKAVNLIKVQVSDMENGNFSDEEIKNAKRFLISGIKSIETEQDSEIVYYLGQEFSQIKDDLDEYVKKIENVTKEQIIEFSKSMNLKMTYFLRN